MDLLLDLLNYYKDRFFETKNICELPVRERAVDDGASELISNDFGVFKAIITR